MRSINVLIGGAKLKNNAFYAEEVYAVNTAPKRVRKVPEGSKLSHFRNVECHYCGIELTQDKVTRDHKHPKSKGGGKGKNLVACCVKCNRRKSNMLYIDFLKLLQVEAKERNT